MLASLEYDRARPPYSPELAQWVLEQIGGSPVDLTLDVGCGTGRSTRWARSFSREVIGIDKSPNMLALAQRINVDPGMSFRLGSAEDLRVAEGALDLILSCGAFEWFNKPLFVSQARRALARGRPTVLVWSWLEPLDDITSRWYGIMRRVLGAHVGPDPNDCQAMASTIFPRNASWNVLRSVHRYSGHELHEFIRSSSYWRPTRPGVVEECGLLIDKFIREAGQDDGTVRLVFREVGFVGHLED